MSGSSLFGGGIRLDAADHDDGEAFGALHTRTMVSNLQHLADSCGQTLIAMPRCADGSGWQRESWDSSVDSDAATTHSVFAPMMVRMMAGGTYKVRVRIAGRLTVADATGLDVRINMFPIRTHPQYGWIDTSSSEGHMTAAINVTSSTGAWLTGDTVLRLSGSDPFFTRPNSRATLTDIAGSPVAVDSAEVGISVIVEPSSTKLTFELTGIYAAEVYGDAGCAAHQRYESPATSRTS